MTVLPLFVIAVLTSTVAPGAQSELVIVKKGASEYHRPGCAVVSDGAGVLAMTRAQAEGRKLEAHAACDPSKVGEGAATSKPAEVFVYVDAAAKLYHLEKCERLGTGKKKMALQDAGVKHWPCPACKPPIRKRPGK